MQNENPDPGNPAPRQQEAIAAEAPPVGLRGLLALRRVRVPPPLVIPDAALAGPVGDAAPDWNQAAADLLQGLAPPSAPVAAAGPDAPFGHMDIARPGPLDLGETAAVLPGVESPRVPPAPGGAAGRAVPALDFSRLPAGAGAAAPHNTPVERPVSGADLPAAGEAPAPDSRHYTALLERARATPHPIKASPVPSASGGDASSSRSATSPTSAGSAGRAGSAGGAGLA